MSSDFDMVVGLLKSWQIFDGLANVTNVAIHVNNLPAHFSDLGWMDKLTLKGCASHAGAGYQTTCVCEGCKDYPCKKLEQSADFDLGTLKYDIYGIDKIQPSAMPVVEFSSAGEATHLVNDSTGH